MSESALLTCNKCGATRRVWLDRCEACCNPEDNQIKLRIEELEEKLKASEKMQLALIDKCNQYSMLLHELRTLASYGSPEKLLNKINDRLNQYLEGNIVGK